MTEALESVTRSVNHNNTISAAFEKDHVVSTLLALRDAGIDMDAEAIEGWALAPHTALGLAPDWPGGDPSRAQARPLYNVLFGSVWVLPNPEGQLGLRAEQTRMVVGGLVRVADRFVCCGRPGYASTGLDDRAAGVVFVVDLSGQREVGDGGGWRLRWAVALADAGAETRPSRSAPPTRCARWPNRR
ncbi:MULTISPECIES: hypothetical protein [Amycolatopsis]|uniref:hypothetical protein n=1 Tax=Amycolatopsis TaxID=1813 RepID=UPI001748253D|nr:hypothetical protein [Amycolatopsis bullii]